MTQQEKLQKAQQDAAESRERNKQECTCEACVMKRIEPTMLQMINNWEWIK